jgi:hypothetical protein
MACGSNGVPKRLVRQRRQKQDRMRLWMVEIREFSKKAVFGTVFSSLGTWTLSGRR